MTTIEELTYEIRKFADEREWAQFHSVRNIVLAMVGEVGELAAEIQWVNDAEVASFLSLNTNKDKFASEIADVATYLLRLCDISGVDLAQSVRNKLTLNSERYPIEKSKGSSFKYTEFKQ